MTNSGKTVLALDLIEAGFAAVLVAALLAIFAVFFAHAGFATGLKDLFRNLRGDVTVMAGIAGLLLIGLNLGIVLFVCMALATKSWLHRIAGRHIAHLLGRLQRS
ncbi:hypothetical protein ACFWXH_07160 [Mesorhizobium sp. NPDC059054]|uniref:hypothetical protein n=1 Tax=unclassified Mesorhizobium TaxID=325217 RepID=UPI0036BA3D67